MIPNGILRSVLDFGGVSQTELIANMQKLISAKLEWDSPADKKLFKYACQFYRERQEVPAKQTLIDYFESVRDLDSQERIKDLEPAQYYIRSNFQHLIDESVKEQKKFRALALLKESQEIIAKGLVFSDTKVKKVGLKDGIAHFLEHVSELMYEAADARIEGDITKDGIEVWDEYVNAKANKALAWGKFTGLNNIDKVVKGVKKGELWVHAAFVGELKTTFAQNWSYNLITQYRTNVFYASLEMPYEQIRQQFYAMHSSNARFKVHGLGPLDYEKIKSGELSDEEESFYQLVIRDFNNNEEYGSLFVWSPEDNVTVDDIKLKAEMQSEAEGGEIGMVVIDHGGIIEPRKSERGKDYTIRLNSVIRDCKKLALHYKHGSKVPVLLLFQINREGKAEADKAEGNRYKLKALSYANECVLEGTLVKTDQGLIPIEKVVPGSHRVWSTTGWKDVYHLFDQGVKPVYKVATKHGLEITTTSNHLLRTIRNEKIDWVPVGDLKAGDILLADLGTRPFPTKSSKLPSPSFVGREKRGSRDGRGITFPTSLTKELAYLMGAYAGDGVSVPGYIRYTGNRKEVSVRNKIVTYFELVFNQKLGLTQCPSRSGSWDLSKSSIPLHRWCVEVGFDRGVEIHPTILSATRAQTIDFLRGFWDTDGHINTQGVLYLPQKGAKTKLLQQVQLLMFDLGIESTLGFGISTLKGKSFPRTTINISSRKGREVFLDLIGFTEPHKQERLRGFVQSTKSAPKKISGIVWPLGDLFSKVVSEHVSEPSRKVKVAIRKWEKYGTPISDGALQEVLQLTRFNTTGDEDLARLRSFSKLRPSLVKSVTELPPSQVFDLEVSGDHEYATGPFFSHNCERSADVVTTTYLNDEHRKDGTTQFDCLKRRDGPHFEPFTATIDWPTKRISNRDPIVSSDKGVTVDDMRNVSNSLDMMFI